MGTIDSLLKEEFGWAMVLKGGMKLTDHIFSPEDETERTNKVRQGYIFSEPNTSDIIPLSMLHL